ncbi:MAG TPA: PEP/pyruvate-binding domain-containing protein [Gemmataceae bacterium]|nr:PEP/pyruvate-binding domain-containing protein [Gemmataceae bacterium]
MSDILQEEIVTLGDGVLLTRRQQGDRLTLVVRVKAGSDCVLHWGLSGASGGWQRPPETSWPPGTTAADGNAVRTPFGVNGQGEREVTIRLDLPASWKRLPFVLHFPKENRWVKNGAQDFSIPLPQGKGPASPEAALASWAPEASAARRTWPLDGGGQVAVATWTTPETMHVCMVSDADGPLLLHWGLVRQFRHEWLLPPEEVRPAGTSVEGQAARTPFAERAGLQYLELRFRKPADGMGPRGMKFILYRPAGNAWLKSGGQDLYLPLAEGTPDPRLSSAKLRDLAEQIVSVEKGAGSWTLMHRFNLCHDLLEQAQDDEEALALLFAWLRYSATRQLDWQRRYNTKPRELSHAQDRLTVRLANIWRRHGPGPRRWARLMLTTLGRGGEGQRVRDEILHIMHRNHLKETSGVFIEEWHQKLHNNTTPDDVVICEAYLAFLRSNGDLGRFYRTLEESGVTRDRLKGFERPIRTDPGFYGDKKDALIGEFEHFLRILKSVHSGTDLESAAGPARGRLDGGLNGKLDGVFALRQRGAPALELAGAIVSMREGLKGVLGAAKDDAAVRDLLFLDLALEEFLRATIERQNLSRCSRDDLARLAHLAMSSVSLSIDAPELAICAGHWGALLGMNREGRDWALHAKSVADRTGRWVATFTDDLYRQLQPKAELLGAAFEVAAWTVPLFSEEVVRGGPAFAQSLLLRHLDPLLRKAAGLGGWQVISPALASGKVRVTDRLLAVQGQRFTEPTVIVTDVVAGNEEIPEGVTAVLTTDTPDLVSHVAVRARNGHVLFATCYEPETYSRLKNLHEKTIALYLTAGGDVEYGEALIHPDEARMEDGGSRIEKRRGSPVRSSILHPRSSTLPSAGWVITQEQFTSALVGGKANNLNGLRGRLPDWIRLPASIALPFGTFERALADESNHDLRREYERLIATVANNPPEVLARVRTLVQEMKPPAALREALVQTWRRVGLRATPWEQIWPGVRRVWASKWNERAYLSRRARGVPHESLLMAVLIQQVVPADYAYVIHTVNPLTRNHEEIYAEVVLGLGETLVGNYPGRALGFVCRKDDLKWDLISYPGKSLGLYGKGVIFRSDSNGEDLEGFAGAGLYDSVLAEEPEHRLLDYRGEQLVWDGAFRDGLLRAVARIGLEVEKVLGRPQDIEGAVAGGVFHVVQTRPQVGL